MNSSVCVAHMKPMNGIIYDLVYTSRSKILQINLVNTRSHSNTVATPKDEITFLDNQLIIESTIDNDFEHILIQSSLPIIIIDSYFLRHKSWTKLNRFWISTNAIPFCETTTTYKTKFFLRKFRKFTDYSSNLTNNTVHHLEIWC